MLNRPWPEEFCQVRGRFLAAQNWDQLGKADAPFALLGAPLDITTSFRSGTGQGPEAIRAASQVLEDYSLELDRDLNAQAFADLGDLPLVPGDLVGSLELIEQAVAHLVAAGGRPFLLGGEHLVTLPVVRALAAVYPDLAVLQFDAHADLRNHYLGWQLSHTTVIRRVAGMWGRLPFGSLASALPTGRSSLWAGARICIRVSACWPAAKRSAGLGQPPGLYHDRYRCL